MKNKKEFSKKLLDLDYAIAILLLVLFCIAECINGVYAMNTLNALIEMGSDISMVTIPAPFNLDIFGVLLGIWIAQLGVSTGAYYNMCKSDHKIQLPIKLIENLPEEVKEQVDMTTLISTALTCTDC